MEGKTEVFSSSKNISRNEKEIHRRRKYMQIIYSIRMLYLEYKKNPCDPKNVKLPI